MGQTHEESSDESCGAAPSAPERARARPGSRKAANKQRVRENSATAVPGTRDARRAMAPNAPPRTTSAERPRRVCGRAFPARVRAIDRGAAVSRVHPGGDGQTQHHAPSRAFERDKAHLRSSAFLAFREPRPRLADAEVTRPRASRRVVCRRVANAGRTRVVECGEPRRARLARFLYTHSYTFGYDGVRSTRKS